MNYDVRTISGSPVEPHTVIFPILKEVEPGRAKLVGTGFFITMLGHFVTAKHVILDALDQKTGQQVSALHAAHFVVGSQVLVRSITEVSYHNQSDVAVGKMDFHVLNETKQPLTNMVPVFTTEPPKVGSPVVTFAYPESSEFFWQDSGSAFRPNFYGGELIEHSEVPRDSVMVSWPHYRTSINALGGASGGPAFDARGRVFGVNCVGGLGDLSYMARVTELLPLTVPQFPPPTCTPGGICTVLHLARNNHINFEPRVA